MDLVVFENNKPWVIDEFREGRFDYVELPVGRRRNQVLSISLWPAGRGQAGATLAVAAGSPSCAAVDDLRSQLSLRLHGQHSLHSYPLIFAPAGWSMRGCGPEVGAPPGRSRKRQSHARMRASTTATSIPARPLAIRTSSASWPAHEPEQLEEWYNRHVAAVYKELGAFDADGLFIADGTYLFVPDNPRYEGSQRLLFDEHTPSRQQETGTGDDEGPAGSLPLATLLQSGAALALRRGWRAIRGGRRAGVAGEGIGSDSAVWPLLDTFLAAVGSAVMKVLLIDRGFINGPEIGRLKRDHGIDTVIPIRSDMNLQEDVRGLMNGILIGVPAGRDGPVN